MQLKEVTGISMPWVEEKERIKKRIVSMRRRGYSISNIAETLEISPTKVHMVLAKSGMFFVRRRPGNNRRNDQIISMRRKGFTLGEIAKRLGVSSTTVHYVLTVLSHFPVAPGISKRTINRIFTLRNRGASLREIGSAVELNFGTVVRILRQQRR
jgi:DNA-binding transcriptional MerR regulator